MSHMSKYAPLFASLLLCLPALACEGFEDFGELGDAEDETGQVSQPVVNGTPVIGYPSTGGLLRGSTPESAFMQCSGTLIGCDTYATAAHCVCEDPQSCNSPIPPSQLYVYFQNAGTYAVSSVAIEPNYSFPGFGDIAIVRLAEPVVGIKPTPIITSNPSVNAAMTIVGYGLTFNGENDSGIKREGPLQRSSCNSFSDDTHMCFTPGNSPSVSCSGDSGGPNFIDIGGVTHLGAIVSGGGTQNSCTGGQKFATNVARFTQFIQANSGELGGECGPLPSASDPTSTISTGEGAGPGGEFTIEVPAGSTELRVGVNAIFGDLDLFVTYGEPAKQENAQCFKQASQTSTCVINSPRAGTWHVNVRSVTPFQVAMTALAGAPVGMPDVFDANAGEILQVSGEQGLLVNDTPGLGLEIIAETVTQAANGQVNIGAAGDFSYLANDGFIGTDTFTYRVREGDYVSQPVTVTVEVTEGGCGCQASSASGGSTWLWLLMLGVFAIRSRRRARRC